MLCKYLNKILFITGPILGHKLYSKVLRPSLYYAPPTYMRPASYSMVIKSYTYARLWSNNFTHLSPLDLFNFPSPFILWCRGFAQFLKCSLSNQAHLLPYILKAKRSADFARQPKIFYGKKCVYLDATNFIFDLFNFPNHSSYFIL